jgi:hypothetical protein
MRVRGFVLATWIFSAAALAVCLILPAALATAPEKPEVLPPAPLTATGATFHGILNPGKEGGAGTYELGTYEFLYSKSPTTCEGESKTPESPGISLGGGKEEVSQAVGLEPDTEYTVCLLARNGIKGETTVGPATTFKTLRTLEAPRTEPATEMTATAWELNGTLNPGSEGEPGAYQFVYRQSATECQGEGEQETSTMTASGVASEKVPGEEVTGLLPNTPYTFCIRAFNSIGEPALGQPETFTTPVVPPKISEVSFFEVGSSSAKLRATIDPGGASTNYAFEYGTTTAYGSETLTKSAGAGSQPVKVETTIEGLQANTPYYFRITASSTGGSSEALGRPLSTLPIPSPGLPDHRQYEIVSPLDSRYGTVVPAIYRIHAPERAAADGDAVAYAGRAPSEGGNGNNGNERTGEENGTVPPEAGDNAYIAKRSPNGSWTTEDLQPPGLNNVHFSSFSSDLSLAMLNSLQGTPTSTPVSERPGKKVNEGIPFARATAAAIYQPLFMRTPPIVPPSEFFAQYVAQSDSQTHLLFTANDALLEGAGAQAKELIEEVKKRREEGKTVSELYDNVGGQLYLVNILPSGKPTPLATFGSSPIPVEGGYSQAELSHVVSTSGSRIFWTDANTEVSAENPEGGTRLFVRQDDTSPDATTVQLDAAEAGCGSCVSGGGVFRTASNDGSRIFFTDDRRLTSHSTAESGEPDLYEYEVNPTPGQAGILRDLTIDPHEPADVLGVLGSSEDGSYLYFAASGALTVGAQPGHCPTPSEATFNEDTSTTCNVYVEHDGELSLVTDVTNVDGEGGFGFVTIPPLGEENELQKGDWVPAVGYRSAQVTPDGTHLVFESVANITGFDSKGAREIYLYDKGTDRTSCISCNPAGAPALFNGKPYAPYVELPPSVNTTYGLRDVSSDGNRVFFDSSEALVPQDKNEQSDVYEWEREGTGTCTPEHTAVEDGGGCLFLISSGTSTDVSMFVDASEDGKDVFFVSRSDLVPADKGEAFQLWDAHECSAEAPCQTNVEPECTGTGCQGVPDASPIFATPSSVTFNGVGNFPPPSSVAVVKPKPKSAKCTKGKRRVRGKCIKNKKKKKKKKKTKTKKPAHTGRGAGR